MAARAKKFPLINLDINKAGSYQKNEFKKLSPTILASRGLSPKSELYQHASGDIITKRDYTKLTTGESNEMRRYKIKHNIRPVAQTAPVKARKEKIRKSAETRIKKKQAVQVGPPKPTKRRSKKKVKLLPTVERVKKTGHRRLIYTGMTTLEQVLDTLEQIAAEFGEQTPVVILYTILTPSDGLVMRQSRYQTVEDFLKYPEDISINTDIATQDYQVVTFSDVVAGALVQYGIKVYL